MRTSQREKVEHLLRANGRHGIHTHELRQAYIANPSERIAELERAGWDISHSRERLNGTAFGCRYVKVAEPEARRASVESDTHKMCGSSEISPGVPLAPDDVEAALRGASGTGAVQAGSGQNDLPHPETGEDPGVPLSTDVEVAGRISNDPPHAGLVVPPAAGDLSTGRLFEVGEPLSTHYEDEAA